MTAVKFKVKGLKELREALDGLGVNTQRAILKLAPGIILRFRGGGKPTYPPTHSGNMPPTPYYIRGIGTQLKSRNVGNSQQMHARFQVKTTLKKFDITNTARYAPYVIGDRITKRSEARGWKSLTQITREKMEEILETGKKAIREYWKTRKAVQRGK